VGSGRSDIEEEWPARVNGLDLLHPGNRLVSDLGGQVIVWIGRPRYAVAVLVEDWLELTRVSGIEALEIIKAQTISPAVEWADLTRFSSGRVVVFTDPPVA
jgi:hypothetical protein